MSQTIDEFLAQANDPELTEAVNGILLSFNLRLMQIAVTLDGTAPTKEKVARSMAREQAEGDQELENDLYQIMMAHIREG